MSHYYDLNIDQKNPDYDFCRKPKFFGFIKAAASLYEAYLTKFDFDLVLATLQFFLH